MRGLRWRALTARWENPLSPFFLGVLSASLKFTTLAMSTSFVLLLQDPTEQRFQIGDWDAAKSLALNSLLTTQLQTSAIQNDDTISFWSPTGKNYPCRLEVTVQTTLNDLRESCVEDAETDGDHAFAQAREWVVMQISRGTQSV